MDNGEWRATKRVFHYYVIQSPMQCCFIVMPTLHLQERLYACEVRQNHQFKKPTWDHQLQQGRKQEIWEQKHSPSIEQKEKILPFGEKERKILHLVDVPIGIICDFDFTFDKLNFRSNAWFSIILFLHLCSLKFQGYFPRLSFIFFLARRFATSAASRAFTLTSLFPTKKQQNSKIHYQLKQWRRRNATINIQHLFNEKVTWSWYASS